jgi:phenylacetic acid degradation operon negative regulatory protein
MLVPDRYAVMLGDLGLEPLPARSVLASALLGTGPSGLRSGLLVRFAELFGIGEGATRVALSRMLATAEAVKEEGRYRPAGPLLDRRRRQETSRWPASTDWTGAWTGALVKPDRRSQGDRLALRRAMDHLKFSEYREGVWMRPDNLARSDFAGEEATVVAQCDRFEIRPHGDGFRLASQLWDLTGWASRARALISGMSLVSTELKAGDVDALTVGFLLSAAVFRHVLADPLLPGPLLPTSWPGDDLRMAFEGHDDAWQSALRLWARGVSVRKSS